VTSPRHGGLGRGLGALIPTRDDGDVAVEGARFAEIPVERIAPNPAQPREHFDPEALAELVTSIREVGLLQPIVVRPTGPESYELVMGERRLRATKEAGLDRIPAIVRDTGDEVMLRDALLENLHRQQLNPLEEAAAYAQLLEDFGTTHEELASRIGRSRSTISNTIRLLQLPTGVQRRVAAGVLSAGHARAILGLPTPELQERMAERVVAEGMSVRGVEEAVTLAGGAEDTPVRKQRSRKESPAEFGVVADRLAERFETRVRVDATGKGRGKVIIEFAGLEDLQRIVDVIDGPGTAGG
jgi:ParB family chromosome partitioning protein